MWYPRECYSINETATREAKREYDRKQATFWDKVYATQGYKNMNARERVALWNQIKEEMKHEN